MRTLVPTESGVRIAVEEHGAGPAVLLVHGFPGLAYSWRHQLPVLEESGYRAIAVDLRGYGDSDRPDPATPGNYGTEPVLSDLVSVLDALEVERATVVGQDFGSQYAWALAQRHPDRVGAVLGTVPFGGRPAEQPPTEAFAAVAARHFLHLHYFQQPGRAEVELGGAALTEFLRRLFWALSAGGDLLSVFAHPGGAGYLEVLPDAPPLPWSWLTAEEFEAFLVGYRAGGEGRELAGGIGSYRAADADWASAREWVGTTIDQPALLVMGEKDPVRTFAPPDADRQRTWLTGLGNVVTVAGAGHFVQAEQPAAFNRILLDFLTATR